ncbi:uncharacterized protein LOC109407288 [Aedes albopictus]|uniref:Uncharacterized protein n=1 Tax=Aedes albopictus TaxID=7160 RepID=A0ABM1Z0L1_AEDAL
MFGMNKPKFEHVVNATFELRVYYMCVAEICQNKSFVVFATSDLRGGESFVSFAMEDNFEVLRSLEIGLTDADDHQTLQEDEADETVHDVPGKSSNISDLEFATAVSRLGSVLLTKNQTPQMKKKKSDAVKEIAMHFLVEKGLDLTEKQIIKKVNNMKSRIKTKTDKKATGNKKISLNPGEQIMYNLLGAEDNPAVTKVNYGISVGADKKVLHEHNSNASDEELHPATSTSTTKKLPTPLISSPRTLAALSSAEDMLTPPPPKIKRLKTNGTRPVKSRPEQENLSTAQLHRLVLAKQLEALDQQMRVNTKLETVLDKAEEILNNYITPK